MVLAHNSGRLNSRSGKTKHAHVQAMLLAPVEDDGTPGESGSPSVATPEPALTRKESACPW